MPQFLLPGYHYLGPGNPLPNGPDVNSADSVAHKHDIEYQNATKPSDIRKSDLKAIKEFAKTGYLGGLIGAAGLSAKYAVESVTGVLYPNMSKYQMLYVVC